MRRCEIVLRRTCAPPRIIDMYRLFRFYWRLVDKSSSNAKAVQIARLGPSYDSRTGGERAGHCAPFHATGRSFICRCNRAHAGRADEDGGWHVALQRPSGLHPKSGRSERRRAMSAIDRLHKRARLPHHRDATLLRMRRSQCASLLATRNCQNVEFVRGNAPTFSPPCRMSCLGERSGFAFLGGDFCRHGCDMGDAFVQPVRNARDLN